MANQMPFVSRIQIPVEPVATAGNDLSTAVKVPVAGSVSSVSYVPLAAKSGADTNSRTVSLINKGSTGTLGTTVIASLAQTAGVDLVAFREKAITLSATAADLVVAAGDILEWKSLHVGTGITDVGGTVVIEISRTL